MGIFHYLNVGEGDCSIIEHPSGHVTVVDVSCAEAEVEEEPEKIAKSFGESKIGGNFRQKESPVNPIAYLKERGINSIFRFIATHPDMDHLDGIRDLFEEFGPVNFWDTDNEEEKDFEETEFQKFNEEDWEFYKSLRDGQPEDNPKRLTLYANAEGKYYNQNEDGSNGGDGIQILAPTEELLKQAIEAGDYNDASYVILYRSNGGRILLCGDSHDNTWDYILKNHKADVKNVEILVAPHHGRKSDRSYDFLDVVSPKLTFFGNAKSEHLAYGPWYNRNLAVITNNQANCMVVDTNSEAMELYVTNESFARSLNQDTWYSKKFHAYYIGQI